MRENLYRLAFVLLMLVLLLVAVSQAKSNVTLTVTPHHCQSPCTVRVNITVPRHKENRWMVLTWSDVMTASGIAASSTISLDGDKEIVYFERYLLGLPQGVYNVAAQLFRNTSKTRVGYSEAIVYVGLTPGEDKASREASHGFRHVVRLLSLPTEN